MCVCTLSNIRLFETPCAIAHQDSVMEFSRQECWSGLPYPTLGDLTEPTPLASPALAGGFFITEPPGNPLG